MVLIQESPQMLVWLTPHVVLSFFKVLVTLPHASFVDVNGYHKHRIGDLGLSVANSRAFLFPCLYLTVLAC